MDPCGGQLHPQDSWAQVAQTFKGRYIQGCGDDSAGDGGSSRRAAGIGVPLLQPPSMQSFFKVSSQQRGRWAGSGLLLTSPSGSLAGWWTSLSWTKTSKDRTKEQSAADGLMLDETLWFKNVLS